MTACGKINIIKIGTGEIKKSLFSITHTITYVKVNVNIKMDGGWLGIPGLTCGLEFIPGPAMLVLENYFSDAKDDLRLK